ncbi:MAG: hypothetical protein ACKOCA_10365 [Vulcanococcus sp.]
MDRLFCFDGGRLQRFEGNYSAYLERQGAAKGHASASAPTPSTEPTAPQPAAPKQRRRSFKETRELQALETELPQWEARRQELERGMATGGADYGALELLSQELSELLLRIEQGEERWLELSELPG